MKRIPFSQTLKNTSIDIKREYARLYVLFFKPRFYDRTSNMLNLFDCCDANFENMPFRGTSISLKDFTECHKYNFRESPSGVDIDYLVSFCEYTYNLVVYCQKLELSSFGFQTNLEMGQAIMFYIQQVTKVIELIGYMANTQDGVTDFVPKSPEAISVAEIVAPNLSYKVIEYNHHSMKGDLEKKRDTLLALADQLEPKRGELKKINSDLETDVFFLYNNLNIRHNNSDPAGKKYKPVIAAMTNKQIEQWYDDAYQMSLLAFLELDNVERKDRVKKLRETI